MTRLSTIAALGVLVGSAAVSLPAFADSVASCRGDTITLRDGRKVETINYNADLITAQLKSRGYDVEGVESWGGCVKAFVNDPGGGSHIAFFDPDTLEPLSY